MVRAALTKLLILVIIIFILCLPEFFTVYRVSKVKFLCLPYRTCEQENQVKKGEKDEIGDAEVRRKVICDPSQTPGDEKWEQACTQESQTNMTNPLSDSRRGSEDQQMTWFMCETDMDMTELHSNMSSSDIMVYLEMSVEVQLKDVESLNFTLYGRSNHSSLHLYPLEEEEEEEEEEEKKKKKKKKKKDDEGQREAFYCCLPVPPTSESASHGRCLLWLANQTVLTATAKEKLPWNRTQTDEWRCMFRVLWLVLLCVLLLTIVTSLLSQIDWKRCCCRKPKVCPLAYDLTGQQLNDKEKYTEINAPKGMIPHIYGSRAWSGLSPIQEVDTPDDIETLMDGNVDLCYTANLHHRSHPSVS
ncbi:uncharacterized protein si:dkey-192k22.2 isoform X1 [Scomber scombrus]|uniref:uncharacterized protein si:dkey-192k22.2 isoform X1 n=1 Tax=Scomber scombrus TaxID=13677 RepID=UPI002DD9B9E5|nr:uncharacterized protein si:dkey-192k22.2 isoform X1 [Scomber scombrus]